MDINIDYAQLKILGENFNNQKSNDKIKNNVSPITVKPKDISNIDFYQLQALGELTKINEKN